MAAGLHVGCRAFSRAATPATWGQDIDVPDNVFHSDVLLSKLEGRFEGGVDPGHAAIMFSPGAARSGYRAESKKNAQWISIREAATAI